MAKNVIYLGCKRGIADLDYTLPVLMELKSYWSHIQIIIVFYGEKDRDVIKQSQFLWEGVLKLDPILITMRGKNKLITLFRFIGFLKLLFNQKNFILYAKKVLPFHNFTQWVIKRISDVTFIYTQLIPNFTFRHNLQIQQQLIQERRNGKPDYMGRMVG